jgi:hypothetical protein
MMDYTTVTDDEILRECAAIASSAEQYGLLYQDNIPARLLCRLLNLYYDQRDEAGGMQALARAYGDARDAASAENRALRQEISSLHGKVGALRKKLKAEGQSDE